MTSTQLAPTPVFRGTDAFGLPLYLGQLGTFIAGTNTPQVTYKDSLGIATNTNPVILNARGECNLWLDPTKAYKLVLSDALGNLIWTVDNVTIGNANPSFSIIPTVNNLFNLGSPSFSWANAYFGANGLPLLDAGGNAGFVARTTAEIAATVTPTDYFYPEGDLRRYGGDPTGAADASTAWQAAINVGVARLAKGCSYKIVTPATKTGQVTILGEGTTSKLLSDGTVLTVTSGTNSVLDNFWMENITAPWIITRNPANWTSPPYATLQQSNAVGYEPTVNDADIWSVSQFTASQGAGTSNIVVTAIISGSVQPGATLSGTGVTGGTSITGQVSGPSTGVGTYLSSNTVGFAATTITTLALTSPQQTQQIGPAVIFTGLSTNIEISRIYGRFVRLDVLDSQYSTVRDCDFRGGKGQWGGVNIDNGTNNVIVGKGNKAIGNTIRYASFSGIIFQNNDGPVMTGNICNLNGESGLKASTGAGALPCVRDVIVGNECSQNYYDGVDAVSNFPSDDTVPCWHNITGNTTYQNGGDGINLAGKYSICADNLVQGNYRYGIWCVGSFTKIVNNYLIDNNQQRNSGQPEILGGNTNNQIVGNFIWSGAGQNSAAIFAQNTHYIADNYAIGSNFNFGNTPASVTSYLLGNVDPTTGLQTEQSFIWGISNNAGTLQHTTYAQSGSAALGNFQNRILNASATPTNTPTGADGATALAAGWKIGSASTNNIWADTNDQLTAANALLMCGIAYNDTGTEIRVRPQIASLNINGVTRFRLTFQFFTAAGVAFALTTVNIPAGKTIQVQFYGKLT